MGTELAWFSAVLLGGAAVLAAERWTRSLEPKGARRPAGRTLGGWAITVGALLLLAVLLRIRAFAELDAHMVATLAGSRSDGLVSVFTAVTTMGDVTPTLLIATALAMAWFLSTGEVRRPIVLPVIVIVELAVQLVIAKGLDVPTLAAIRPGVVIGGAGPIPSGSVARLFSVFLVAAFLWRSRSVSSSRRLVVIGCVLTLVELVSRLYLGRHFATDVAGGLLLGVLLSSGFAWVLTWIGNGTRPTTQRERGTADNRGGG